MYNWTIYFYDCGGHRHDIVVKADSFDTAIEIALKEDSRYCGGFRQDIFL